MGAYNVKVFDYVDGVQVRMYNRPLSRSEEVKKVREISGEPKDKKSLDVRTDESIAHSLRVSKERTVNQMYEITRANTWEYFLTLTFDRKLIDSSNYDLLSQKVSKWINNLRSRYAPDLKYILVPELHKDGVHYHFHGLLSNIGNIKLVDSGIKKHGLTIYNMANWKYGFSTVSAVQDNAKVASYITKYITKELCQTTKGKRRYWCSKNCDRAKVHSFNLDYEDIENIIDENQHLLTYVTNSKINDAGLEVSYFELKKGENNAELGTV